MLPAVAKSILGTGSFVLAALAFSWAPPVLADETSEVSESPSSDQIQFFETAIRPLLANHCYDCHSEETQEGELRLDSLEGILVGGNAGSPVVAGKPNSSLLLTAVSHRDSELRMPPDEKLSDRQIADLTRWIEIGAPHPDSGQVEVVQTRRSVDMEAGRKHWAFRPITSPGVPGSLGSSVNPIDSFVAAELKRHDLVPLRRADKRKLIRRASFDLIGLPPTPEEIKAFLVDESEDAFGRVVDRLLESPHYGERWGRHWLDVARYADSNGLDENAAYGNAWRYRDYVVQSFNEDKPYDQFVTEQLAGDLLDSQGDIALKNQRVIATGYLTLGPKVLAEVDEQKMEMDIVDEQIDTIGRGLMGLTLGCVRCHTHKFDPLEHEDYYALAGIFQSTQTMESFTKVAKWNEVSIASADDLARKQEHNTRVAAKKQEIDDRVASATSELETPAGETIPEDSTAADVEKRFPESTQAELKKLRGELKQIAETPPVMPTAMAVSDGAIVDAAVHIRGSHLTLGETVPRGFPRVLCDDEQASLPEEQSGRLEFARWLTSPDHPLTARVMVNRIWRWHFGKGLVATVDNFGTQGDPPTHPELLDWLAIQFMEGGWSIKAMHRSIMLSETYQRSSEFDANNALIDGDNRFYWRSDVRRLEAEAIRDSLLVISGKLDRTLGGPVLETPNRTLVFNHTSQDTSNYDATRRSIYVPIIRNHLYDMFQLFDYNDASVLTGNRNTSTLSPQALFLMNSDLVADVTTSMAERLLKEESSRQTRIARVFEESYGRLPTDIETRRIADFLTAFEEQSSVRNVGIATDVVDLVKDPSSTKSSTRSTTKNPSFIEPAFLSDHAQAWQALCQSIVSSSEFVYLR